MRLVAPLVMILGFGVFKTPLEQGLFHRERAARFQEASLNLHLRSQLGQMGFVAALSGFRALVADFLWIRAGSAFERTEWGRLKLHLESVTQLQPRGVLFWDMAHFYMAYDAATSVREDELAQPSDALRRKAEREYLKIGEQFLVDGLSFNPESAKLAEHLALLYSKKFREPAKAAEYYALAAQKPGAMEYVRRFSAFELAKVPGQERLAYERLKALYLESERQRVPTLVRLIQELEEKLAVPASERIYSPAVTAPSR